MSFRVNLVTARGRAVDYLPPLIVRDQGGKDGVPDESVETVKVSQAPAVSEAPAEATPVAGGASFAALPSAVQDLARFFLSLSGSSSLGAVGGVAGVAASTAGSGVQLCPSTSAGGAVALGAATAIPAGASGPPAAPAAVPGVSGLQQHQEASRSGRRHRRSSSDGTNRRSKKRPRGRSPSPGHSSRRREKHYLASSSLSEEDRADASPPRAGRAPGGSLHLAIFVPLLQVTALHDLDLRVGRRGRLLEETIIDQALVVDPLLPRERRMTTG